MNLPEIVKKKKEAFILAGLALGMGVLIFFGMRMQHTYLGGGGDEEQPAEKVRFETPGTAQGEAEQEQQKSKPVSSYFLKPSPSEVMSMVKEIVASELPVPREKYANLRIVWPVYFFRIVEQNGTMVTVHFDTSQDGFGVTVSTVIDSLVNPEILTVTEYRKVWLAGEITAIDATGTGTIHMNTDHIRFREELEEVRKAEQKAEGG